MRFAVLIVALMLALVSPPASAQSPPPVVGQVLKVDAKAQKITIRHGPWKKFGMDEGMTMVFRVKDPAMLKEVKAGDKIRFDGDQVNGQFTVTRIEKR